MLAAFPNHTKSLKLYNWYTSKELNLELFVKEITLRITTSSNLFYFAISVIENNSQRHNFCSVGVTKEFKEMRLN